MQSISVYASSSEARGEGDQVSVFLANVDVGQVVKEFAVDDVLDSMEYSDIKSYIIKTETESGESDE